MIRPILVVNNIEKRFGGLAALSGCTLEVFPGEICGLIGPNGSGKSTLFDVITGFVKADSGEVVCDGVCVNGLAPNNIAALGLARTFQSDRLPRRMTVLENMLLARPDQIGERVLSCLIQPVRVKDQERENLERSYEILNYLNISNKANAEVDELSGGQRKLLALGQALMRSPKLLLLDEPVAGVNPILITEIEQRLQTLGKSGQNILLVEHNIHVVRRICDRVYVMDAGKVIAHGAPEKVLREEAVLEAYLARNSDRKLQG